MTVKMFKPHPEVVADNRLTRLTGLVEATSNEKHLLWRLHAQEARRHSCALGDAAPVHWRQDRCGLFVQVGEFGGMPVNVELSFAYIEGELVAFWHACSAVAHHGMIDEWFAKWTKAPDGGAPSRANADNFHNVLHDIARKTAAPKAVAA